MGQLAVTQAEALARTQLGVPYLFGGTTWNVHMDCSGFIEQLWLRMGLDMARTSQEQYGQALGGNVSRTMIQPGDLIFFVGAQKPAPDHVGMCLMFNANGSGTFINEPRTGSVCRIDAFSIYTLTGPLAIVGITRPANLLPDPQPAPLEDDDMQLLVTGSGGTVYVVAADLSHKKGLPQPGDLKSLAATGIYKTATLDDALLKSIPSL